jgi:GNAT superfamily N-acetyltransferase
VIDDATAEDVPDLANFMASSDLLARYRITPEAALGSLSAAFQAGDILLVSRADRVVGLAWLSLAPRILNGAAYLRLLLVARDVRNAGTGSSLLAAVEARAREQANHLYLLATTDNSSARRFYERRGYRYVGRLPSLVWPDLDEALYYKTLRSHQERLGS